jgi:hypothetical protein
MVALTIVAYAIISGVDGPGILPGAARPPGPRRALPVRARSPSSLGRRSRKPRRGPAAGLVAAARPDRAGSAAPGEAAGLSRLRGPRNGRLSSRPTPARRQQGPARAASSTGNAKRAGCSGFTARSAWQNNPICARPGLWHHAQLGEQIGGSARCYQAIFVPSTALASPGYDGQPAVYIAGLRPNPTRHASAGGCRGGPVGGFRLALKAVHNVTVHSPLAAVGWPLPAEPPAGAHDDATPYCR